jgi:broad specificity phosphatase PhoE
MDDVQLKPGEVVVAYFVRHGDTDDNQDDIYKPNNAPLNKDGIAQVRAAKKFLENKEFGQAYSGTDARTAQTGKIILEGRKNPLEKDQMLNHFDVGEAVGKKKVAYKDIAIKVRQDKNEKFPGSNESLNDFDSRIRRPVLKALRVGLLSGKPSVVFAHDSVLHGMGRLLHNNSKSALVKPGGVVRVIWNGKDFVSQVMLCPKTDSESGPHNWS